MLLPHLSNLQTEKEVDIKHWLGVPLVKSYGLRGTTASGDQHAEDCR